MSGLEKIKNQILDDAEKEAKEILAKADEEAAGILEAARKKVARQEEEAALQAQQKRAAQAERVKSSAELKKRQAILGAKQQIITKLLDTAYEAILKKEDSQYFGLLEKMLHRFVLAKQGEIYFSKRDLDRMPKDFELTIGKVAAEKGGSLSLEREPRNIDGGFILVYGGVEENCTFKALFSDKRDELSDKVHGMLFS